MEQELVRLVVGGFAVVARDGDVEARRDDAALDRLETLHGVLGDDDGVRALSLGDGEADRRAPFESPARVARHRPGALVELGRTHNDVGDVLDVDGPTVARGQEQEPDVGNALQRLPGDDGNGFAVVAERASQEGPVGVGELVRQLAKGDSVEREALRVRFDPDLARRAADDVGRAHAVDFRQFVLQLFRDLPQAVVRPFCGFVGRGRQRQDQNGDVVDAATDDEGIGNALGDVADGGADLLVYPEHRRVLISTDQKARGDDDTIVLGL